MTSSEQIRSYSGPPLFSYGFRPFFFAGSIVAASLPALMALSLAGKLPFDLPYGSVAYHGHEMIFGFLAAIIAGFILTAVPNWTGQLPITGRRLIVLFLIWLAGRVAFIASDLITPIMAALFDVAFFIILASVISREIIAGKNWRNMPITLIIALFAMTNLLWHWLYWLDQDPTLALYAAITLATILISLIGGRIVPSFTSNWLAKSGQERLNVSFAVYDKIAILSLALAMLSWLVAPEHILTASLLLGAGLLHLVRLIRWQGWKTTSEPLVTILHLGYLWLPIGVIFIGSSILSPQTLDQSTALHTLTSGAMGVMTLAVMTRATLGHTGQELQADRCTVLIYTLVNLGALIRVLGAYLPFEYPIAVSFAALLWSSAFLLYACYYGRYLVKA